MYNVANCDYFQDCKAANLLPSLEDFLEKNQQGMKRYPDDIHGEYRLMSKMCKIAGLPNRPACERRHRGVWQAYHWQEQVPPRANVILLKVISLEEMSQDEQKSTSSDKSLKSYTDVFKMIKDKLVFYPILQQYAVEVKAYLNTPAINYKYKEK